VVSEAAGSFENNLPKLRCVCSDCNAYFGINLEPAFFWGTIEAYMRLYTGARPAEGISKLAQGRLSFAIQTPGPWHGVRLTLLNEDDRVVTSLVPQVGFQTVGPRGGFVYVTRDELLAGDTLPPGICLDLGIKLIVPSKEVERELIELLAQRGIRFREYGPMPPPPTEDDGVLTTIKTPIDDVVRRYVAKLAFNYLARFAGPDFALRSCFDPIRRYVRFGTVPSWPFFSMTDESPLSDETKELRYTRGHVLGVHWPRYSHDVLAKVRLFNGPTYQLILSRDVRELWRPLTHAHLFDPYKRRAYPLHTFEAIPTLVRHRSGVTTRALLVRP